MYDDVLSYFKDKGFKDIKMTEINDETAEMVRLSSKIILKGMRLYLMKQFWNLLSVKDQL